MSSLLLITQLHIYFSLTGISSSRDFLQFLDINFPEQGDGGISMEVSWWEYMKQKGLNRVEGNPITVSQIISLKLGLFKKMLR